MMIEYMSDPETGAKADAFLQRLRSSTAASHRLLEAHPLLTAIILPVVTRYQYCQYLSIMYRIELAYESAILTPLSLVFPQQKLRTSSSLLKEDMLNTGIKVDASEILKPFVVDDTKMSIAQKLGFKYVMEGSKLGGKVIFKNIQRNLGYSPESGASFISDGGVNTMVLWRLFLSKFSYYIAANNSEDAAIDGAESAFSSIRDFFIANQAGYEN